MTKKRHHSFLSLLIRICFSLTFYMFPLDILADDSGVIVPSVTNPEPPLVKIDPSPDPIPIPTEPPPPILPELDQVIQGQLDISQKGTHMDMHQGREDTIANFNSFNIGEDHSVHVHQHPDTFAFFRVTNQTNISRIDGLFKADANILLVTPNGLLIGEKGVLDMRSVMLTTHTVSDDAFLNRSFTNTLSFDSPLNPDAIISNHGTIKTSGFAALVAPTVRNSGLIQGNIFVGAGNKADLSFAGSDLIQMRVSGKLKKSLIDQRSSGKLSAQGKKVVISASAVEEAANGVINLRGTIDASDGQIIVEGDNNTRLKVHGDLSVEGKTGKGGKIYLNAPVTHVEKTATLKASSKDHDGGDIRVFGEHIGIHGDKTLETTGATLDASGGTKGGLILVGGDKRGQGDKPRAKSLFVDYGTNMKADSTKSGDAGDIVLWSDAVTRMYGFNSASALGATGGAGTIEWSGKKFLHFEQRPAFYPKLLNKNGKLGTIIIDPSEITVDSGSNPYNAGATGATIVGAQWIVDQISSSSVYDLSWTNVHLVAANTIKVDSPIITDKAGAELKLTASTLGSGTINVNQPITLDWVGYAPYLYPPYVPEASNLKTSLEARTINVDAQILTAGNIHIAGVSAVGTTLTTNENGHLYTRNRADQGLIAHAFTKRSITIDGYGELRGNIGTAGVGLDETDIIFNNLGHLKLGTAATPITIIGNSLSINPSATEINSYVSANVNATLSDGQYFHVNQTVCRDFFSTSGAPLKVSNALDWVDFTVNSPGKTSVFENILFSGRTLNITSGSLHLISPQFDNSNIATINAPVDSSVTITSPSFSWGSLQLNGPGATISNLTTTGDNDSSIILNHPGKTTSITSGTLNKGLYIAATKGDLSIASITAKGQLVVNMNDTETTQTLSVASVMNILGQKMDFLNLSGDNANITASNLTIEFESPVLHSNVSIAGKTTTAQYINFDTPEGISITAKETLALAGDITLKSPAITLESLVDRTYDISSLSKLHLESSGNLSLYAWTGTLSDFYLSAQNIWGIDSLTFDARSGGSHVITSPTPGGSIDLSAAFANPKLTFLQIENIDFTNQSIKGVGAGKGTLEITTAQSLVQLPQIANGFDIKTFKIDGIGSIPNTGGAGGIAGTLVLTSLPNAHIFNIGTDSETIPSAEIGGATAGEAASFHNRDITINSKGQLTLKHIKEYQSLSFNPLSDGVDNAAGAHWILKPTTTIDATGHDINFHQSRLSFANDVTITADNTTLGGSFIFENTPTVSIESLQNLTVHTNGTPAPTTTGPQELTLKALNDLYLKGTIDLASGTLAFDAPVGQLKLQGDSVIGAGDVTMTSPLHVDGGPYDLTLKLKGAHADKSLGDFINTGHQFKNLTVENDDTAGKFFIDANPNLTENMDLKGVRVPAGTALSTLATKTMALRDTKFTGGSVDTNGPVNIYGVLSGDNNFGIETDGGDITFQAASSITDAASADISLTASGNIILPGAIAASAFSATGINISAPSGSSITATTDDLTMDGTVLLNGTGNTWTTNTGAINVTDATFKTTAVADLTLTSAKAIASFNPSLVAGSVGAATFNFGDSQTSLKTGDATNAIPLTLSGNNMRLADTFTYTSTAGAGLTLNGTLSASEGGKTLTLNPAGALTMNGEIDDTAGHNFQTITLGGSSTDLTTNDIHATTTLNLNADTSGTFALKAPTIAIGASKTIEATGASSLVGVDGNSVVTVTTAATLVNPENITFTNQKLKATTADTVTLDLKTDQISLTLPPTTTDNAFSAVNVKLKTLSSMRTLAMNFTSIPYTNTLNVYKEDAEKALLNTGSTLTLSADLRSRPLAVNFPYTTTLSNLTSVSGLTMNSAWTDSPSTGERIVKITTDLTSNGTLDFKRSLVKASNDVKLKTTADDIKTDYLFSPASANGNVTLDAVGSVSMNQRANQSTSFGNVNLTGNSVALTSADSGAGLLAAKITAEASTALALTDQYNAPTVSLTGAGITTSSTRSSAFTSLSLKSTGANHMTISNDLTANTLTLDTSTGTGNIIINNSLYGNGTGPLTIKAGGGITALPAKLGDSGKAFTKAEIESANAFSVANPLSIYADTVSIKTTGANQNISVTGDFHAFGNGAGTLSMTAGGTITNLPSTLGLEGVQQYKKIALQTANDFILASALSVYTDDFSIKTTVGRFQNPASLTILGTGIAGSKVTIDTAGLLVFNAATTFGSTGKLFDEVILKSGNQFNISGPLKAYAKKFSVDARDSYNYIYSDLTLAGDGTNSATLNLGGTLFFETGTLTAKGYTKLILKAVNNLLFRGGNINAPTVNIDFDTSPTVRLDAPTTSIKAKNLSLANGAGKIKSDSQLNPRSLTLDLTEGTANASLDTLLDGAFDDLDVKAKNSFTVPNTLTVKGDLTAESTGGDLTVAHNGTNTKNIRFTTSSGHKTIITTPTLEAAVALTINGDLQINQGTTLKSALDMAVSGTTTSPSYDLVLNAPGRNISIGKTSVLSLQASSDTLTLGANISSSEYYIDTQNYMYLYPKLVLSNETYKFRSKGNFIQAYKMETSNATGTTLNFSANGTYIKPEIIGTNAITINIESGNLFLRNPAIVSTAPLTLQALTPIKVEENFTYAPTTAGASFSANKKLIPSNAGTTLTLKPQGMLTLMEGIGDNAGTRFQSVTLGNHTAQTVLSTAQPEAHVSVGGNVYGEAINVSDAYIRLTKDIEFNSSGPLTVTDVTQFEGTAADAQGLALTLNGDFVLPAMGNVHPLKSLTVNSGDGEIDFRAGRPIVINGDRTLISTGAIHLDNADASFVRDIGTLKISTNANVSLRDIGQDKAVTVLDLSGITGNVILGNATASNKIILPTNLDLQKSPTLIAPLIRFNNDAVDISGGSLTLKGGISVPTGTTFTGAPSNLRLGGSITADGGLLDIRVPLELLQDVYLKSDSIWLRGAISGHHGLTIEETAGFSFDHTIGTEANPLKFFEWRSSQSLAGRIQNALHTDSVKLWTPDMAFGPGLINTPLLHLIPTWAANVPSDQRIIAIQNTDYPFQIWRSTVQNPAYFNIATMILGDPNNRVPIIINNSIQTPDVYLILYGEPIYVGLGFDQPKNVEFRGTILRDKAHNDLWNGMQEMSADYDISPAEGALNSVTSAENMPMAIIPLGQTNKQAPVDALQDGEATQLVGANEDAQPIKNLGESTDSADSSDDDETKSKKTARAPQKIAMK